MESLFSTETQTAMQFPASLTEIYKPRAIGEFAAFRRLRRFAARLQPILARLRCSSSVSLVAESSDGPCDRVAD